MLSLLHRALLNSTRVQAIDVNDIVVTLAGRDGERLTFTTEACSLSPGLNTHSLFCPVRDITLSEMRRCSRWHVQSATLGQYALHSSQIKIERLIFLWQYMHPVNTKIPKAKRPTTLVSIPKDIGALDVRLRQSFRSEPLETSRFWSYLLIAPVVEIGKQPKIILALSTGRNNVSKAMLRLSAPSGVQFHIDQFALEGDGMLHKLDSR